MQANKASEATAKELKEWLEKPATSAEAGLGVNTQHDLQWLEHAKDLSSIDLNEKDLASGPSDTGGGWFAALFGCGGKRK